MPERPTTPDDGRRTLGDRRLESSRVAEEEATTTMRRAASSHAGDLSPQLPWSASTAVCGPRVRKLRTRARKLSDGMATRAAQLARAVWTGRCGGATSRLRGKRRQRAMMQRCVRVLFLIAALVVVGRRALGLGGAKRHKLRRSDIHMMTWADEAAKGRETHHARRLVCGLDGDRLKMDGKFTGRNRRFRPKISEYAASGNFSGGQSRAKTIVLTGLNASDKNARMMLEAFLTHYIDFGKIPAGNLYVVLQVPDERLENAQAELARELRKRHVTYDVYRGKTLLHSDLSRYWQKQLAGVTNEEDWVILADIDEHLFVPPRHDLGSEKYSIPLFLERADELNYELVNGVWFDRISEDGKLDVSTDESVSMHKMFPRKCHVGPACDVRRSPPMERKGKPLPREGMVIAHKLKFSVSDVRVLHDFAFDDVVTASSLDIHVDNIFPIPISVQHYQWHSGAAQQIQSASYAYGRCEMEQAREMSMQLAEKLHVGFIDEKTCPELACSKSSSDDADKDVRRIAIVTTVWEHVDGVSRTMKRFADYLRGRDDSNVLVMSPDLAERDYVQANSYDHIHQLVAPVPAIEVPGRPEYKMAAPLQARQRAVLEAYNPQVVHVAAPDMLGHSAVKWAAEVKACSVCSYHTAFDTYMQYYRVSLLSHPIRHLLKDFYSMCDVVAVPTYAAAQHLRSLGVPGEKMGFFPRGVNRTMYSPEMRDEAYRKEVFGAQPDEIVILWVARIVREKGLANFITVIKELNKVAKTRTDLPRFRVVVAGDGPDLGWVRTELEVYDNVVILGHKGGTNLAKTYAAGDIFFFPSKTEVIPNNLIEAMAGGLPVVTDDVGVNRAIVQDEISGIIVKGTSAIEDDVTNYITALTRLMTDRDVAKKMSKAAIDSTVGLTWERTFQSLLHAYDRCRPGLPYARHISHDNLDNPSLYPKLSSDAVEKYRDVIVDADAPDNSLLYRISRGITGGYVKSLDDAKKDDLVVSNNEKFER